MIEVYTDGSYASSRNQGGYAFVVVKDDKFIYKECGGFVNTTNNRMELYSVIEAVKFITSKNVKAVIYSDSMYVIGTITKNWKIKKNVDLWEKYWAVHNDNITFKHVKGHAGNKWNEECDLWAVFGSKIVNCKNDLENE